MASDDPFANFSCLDELTQVIYQGLEKFVVISSVSDKWTVHLGLNGYAGRWWSGNWTEEDIHKLFGSKSSDKLLESFAEKLAQLFIQGELCVSDWSTEKGAKIKLTLGPTTKKPIHIVLTEMTSAEAAAYATKMFIEIALQAQSRKCRLYPSTAGTEATPVEVAYVPRSRTGAVSMAENGDVKNKSSAQVQRGDQQVDVNISDNDSYKQSKKSSSGTIFNTADRKAKAAEQEFKTVNSQVQSGKRTASPVSKAAGPSRVQPHKGASLANPNKKARKYQAIEFGSDDDDD